MPALEPVQADDHPAHPDKAVRPERAAWTCDQGMGALLDRFADVRAVHAHFQEEKTIALLAAPLSSEGHVRFVAPDVLLREQTSPVPAAMLLDGGTVHFRDASGQRSARLSAWEAAEGLVSGYLDLLRGDAAALSRHYAHRFSCEGTRWRLSLTPKTAALRNLLRSMVLEGEDGRLLKSEMVDAHGDRTVTRFSDHAPAAALDDAQALRARFAHAPGAAAAR